MRSAIIQYCWITEPANLTHCQCRVNYSLRLEQNALAFVLEGKKKLFGHYVQPQLEFHQTLANFSRPLSDDRLLFEALWSVSNTLNH